MKYWILVSLACCLCACMSVKRSQTAREGKRDSIAFKTEGITWVAKLDSTLEEWDSRNFKKKVDSDYSRVTIIREYYAGVNSIDSAANDTSKVYFPNKVKTGKNSAHEAHPGSSKTGGLLYRETTIKENGTVKSQNEQTTASIKNNSFNKVDSTSARRADSTLTSNSTSTEEKHVDKTGQWPWWVWLVIAVIALWLLYKLYKTIRSKWP